MEVEFLQSELLVKALGDKKESYQKAYVDVRQMKYFILYCNGTSAAIHVCTRAKLA